MGFTDTPKHNHNALRGFSGNPVIPERPIADVSGVKISVCWLSFFLMPITRNDKANIPSMPTIGYPTIGGIDGFIICTATIQIAMNPRAEAK